MGNLRKLSLRINEELDSDILKEILFLLHGILKSQDRECIKNDSLELFRILENRGLIKDDDICFLLEILEEVNLKSVAKNIKEEFIYRNAEIECRIDTRIKILHRLGQEFDTNDVKKAKFILKFKPSVTGNIGQCQWQMMYEAIRCQKLDINNPIAFVEKLENRALTTALEKIIEEFQNHERTCSYCDAKGDRQDLSHSRNQLRNISKPLGVKYGHYSDQYFEGGAKLEYPGKEFVQSAKKLDPKTNFDKFDYRPWPRQISVAIGAESMDNFPSLSRPLDPLPSSTEMKVFYDRKKEQGMLNSNKAGNNSPEKMKSETTIGLSKFVGPTDFSKEKVVSSRLSSSQAVKDRDTLNEQSPGLLGPRDVKSRDIQQVESSEAVKDRDTLNEQSPGLLGSTDVKSRDIQQVESSQAVKDRDTLNEQSPGLLGSRDVKSRDIQQIERSEAVKDRDTLNKQSPGLLASRDVKSREIQQVESSEAVKGVDATQESAKKGLSSSDTVEVAQQKAESLGISSSETAESEVVQQKAESLGLSSSETAESEVAQQTAESSCLSSSKNVNSEVSLQGDESSHILSSVMINNNSGVLPQIRNRGASNSETVNSGVSSQGKEISSSSSSETVNSGVAAQEESSVSSSSGVLELKNTPLKEENTGSSSSEALKSSATLEGIGTMDTSDPQKNQQVKEPSQIDEIETSMNSLNISDQKQSPKFSISLIRQLNMSDMASYYGREDKDVVSSRGEFGTVYKGVKKYCGQDIVVKQMQDNGENYKAFLKEKLLGRVVHPFLVPVFALAEGSIPGNDEIKYCCIMYPFMENKDLRYMLDDRSSELKWRIRIRIMCQAAQGLCYLHTPVPNYRQKSVHCDVKSANILIDHNLNARLGDCGFAKELKPETENVSVTQRPGTLGYGCPDLIDLQNYQTKYDVFSLGVVMLEMLTGEKPRLPKTHYKNRRKKYETNLFDHYKKGCLKKLQDDADPDIWPSDDKEQIFKDHSNDFASLALKAIDEYNTFTTEDLCTKLKELLRTGSIDSFSSQEEYRNCLSCMLNPRASSSLSICECIPVCIKCLQTYYRNPLHCPVHERSFSRIGESVCMVMVAGNDTRENGKPFADTMVADVNELYNVMTSRYPHYIGVRKEMVEIVLPVEPGKFVGSMKQTVKMAFQKSTDKIKNSNLDKITFIFYFTGHSDPSGLWLESSEDFLEPLELKKFFFDLPHGKVTQILAILDCCTASARNLVYGTEKLAEKLTDKIEEDGDLETEMDTVPVDFEENLKEVLEKGSGTENAETSIPIWQWSSSSHDQISNLINRKKISLFTKFLTQGIKGRTCKKCFLEKGSISCGICEKYHDLLKSANCITLVTINKYITDHLEECHKRGLTRKKQVPGFKSEHFTDEVFAFSTEDIKIDLHIKDQSGSDVVVEHIPEDIEDLRKTLLSKLKENVLNHGGCTPIPDEVDSSVIQIWIPTSHTEVRELQTIDEVMASWMDLKPEVCIRRDPDDIINGPIVHLDVEQATSKNILGEFFSESAQSGDCYRCFLSKRPKLKKSNLKTIPFYGTVASVLEFPLFELQNHGYSEDTKLEFKVFDTFVKISLLTD